VNFRNDGSHEGNQYFYLKATNLSGNATMGRSRGSTYILNDDPQPVGCPTRTVSWGSRCSGTAAACGHGCERWVSGTHISASARIRGSATATCSNGSWQLSYTWCSVNTGGAN
ncbi:hypothetical protein, partial [Rhodovibrio sodomensis]|uniref:hypothetical protein n=1 Tax=Rhodovibrio sodomensis TaxID=1088 RepID=UPI001A923F97